MKYVLLIMILLVGCSTTPAEPTPIPTIVPTATSTPEEKAEREIRLNEYLEGSAERRENKLKEKAINALIDALGGEYLQSCTLEETDSKLKAEGLDTMTLTGEGPDWFKYIEIKIDAEAYCREEVEKAIDWESLELRLTDEIRWRMR